MSAPSASENRKFANDCLATINTYRQLHGVPVLTLNSEITKISQAWADHLGNTNSMGHNPSARYRGEDLGENVAMNYRSDGADYTGKQAVDQWYSEIENYDFKRNSGPKTGHFTQLVWKDSRELGVGRARTRDGKWMAVTNFFPPGNYVGQNASNVFPPSGSNGASANNNGCSIPKKDDSNKNKPSGGSGGGGIFGWFKGDQGASKQSAPARNDNYKPSATFGNSGGNSSGQTIKTEIQEEISNGYKKIITTETITNDDGSTRTTKREQLVPLANSNSGNEWKAFKSPSNAIGFNNDQDFFQDFSMSNNSKFSAPNSSLRTTINNKNGGDFGGPTSSSSSSSSSGSRTKREVHEEIVGSGPNRMIKTVTIETTTGLDGSVKTSRREETRTAPSQQRGF